MKNESRKGHIRNSVILLAIVFLLAGCTASKCVKVVDAQGKPVPGATLRFSALIKPNDKRLGGLVTTYFPFYEVLVGTTDEKGVLCFSEHKEEDSQYLYTDAREWRFRSDGTWARFHFFERIPETVELEKMPPAEDDEELRIQLRRD